MNKLLFVVSFLVIIKVTLTALPVHWILITWQQHLSKTANEKAVSPPHDDGGDKYQTHAQKSPRGTLGQGISIYVSTPLT